MKRIVAIDTETHRFKPYSMAPKLVCLSLSSEEDSGVIVEGTSILNTLETLLSAAIAGKIILTGHSVSYDFAVLLANFPTLWDKIWQAYKLDGIVCTGVRERLLDIALGTFRVMRDEEGEAEKNTYSLADLAKKRLKKTLKKGAKSWQLRFDELDGVSIEAWPDGAVDYAIEDARTTEKIFHSQEKTSLAIRYSMPTQFEDSRADFALRLMSIWGIRTDSERVSKLWDVTIKRMLEIASRLAEEKLVSFPKKSKVLWDDDVRQVPKIKKNMAEIRSLVRKTYPSTEIPLTDGGQTSTAKETLEACDHKLLNHLIHFNQLQKAAGTYIVKLFDPIIHASYFAVGTFSDRTSSFNPNLQNLPRLPGIRECIIPREGFVFVACDFDSQEMRTLAQNCLDICGTSKLATRYQEDRYYDPHLDFASLLAHISFEDAKEIMKSENHSEEKVRLKQLRQEAKVANFGFSGGMGVKSFIEHARSWGLYFEEHEANVLRNAWFEQWPEMRLYFDNVRNIVGEVNIGAVVIPQSGFKRENCKYTDAANTYFQTLAAHASKAALFEVSRRAYSDRYSFLYGSRPVVFIHDEILLEAPEEAASLAAIELEMVLCQSMAKWTPDVPAAASATLMRRWSKKAERIENEKGELIPWEES